MLKWILRTINHLIVIKLSSWETIKAKKFFKVLEENDLKHILKRYVINYDQSRLLDAYEKIMNQYETGLNDNSYTNKMRLVNDNLRKENQITALVICFELFKLDPKLAIEELKYFGVNLKDNTFESLIELRNIIAGKRTMMNINAIREKEGEPEKSTTFEETLVNFEDILNKDTIDENMSLKKWVFYFKQCRMKIKQQKKQVKNARTA